MKSSPNEIHQEDSKLNFEPPAASADKPNLFRYFIGIVLAIITLLVGLFLVTSPTWLQVLILALGVIEVVATLVRTPRVIRYLSSR